MRFLAFVCLVSIFLLAGCQFEMQTGVYLTSWHTRETNHGTWITIEGRNNTDRDIISITLLVILYRDGQVWKRITLKDEAQYGLNAPARSGFTLCLYLCQYWQSEGDFDNVGLSIVEVEFRK